MSDLTDIDIAFLQKNATDERGVLQPLLAELQRHRSTMARLEAWAMELESTEPVHGVGKFIAAELRNRMTGDVHG